MSVAKAVDVGYAWVNRYKADARYDPQMHAVRAVTREDGRRAWVTVCSEKDATREYRAWMTGVKCSRCIRVIREGEEARGTERPAIKPLPADLSTMSVDAMRSACRAREIVRYSSQGRVWLEAALREWERENGG